MKKIILTISMMVFICLSAYGRPIDITSPARGYQWEIERGYTIRWEKSGVQRDKVTIYLMDSRGRRTIFIISRSAPNSGRFQWKKIPRLIHEGEYKIKIREVGGRITGTSGLFKIKSSHTEKRENSRTKKVSTPVSVYKKKPTKVRLEPLPDLQIKDFTIDNRRNLKVSVTSGLIGFRGDIEFKILSYDDTRYDVALNDIRLNSREVKNFPIFTFPLKYNRDWRKQCGYNISVRIDPDNKIDESNENNNRIEQTIFVENIIRGILVRVGRSSRVKRFRGDEIKFNASELHAVISNTYSGIPLTSNREINGRSCKIPYLDIRLRLVNCGTTTKTFNVNYGLGESGLFSTNSGTEYEGGTITLEPNEDIEIAERINDIYVKNGSTTGDFRIQLSIKESGVNSYKIFSGTILVKPDLLTKYK